MHHVNFFSFQNKDNCQARGQNYKQFYKRIREHICRKYFKLK